MYSDAEESTSLYFLSLSYAAFNFVEQSLEMMLG